MLELRLQFMLFIVEFFDEAVSFLNKLVFFLDLLFDLTDIS